MLTAKPEKEAVVRVGSEIGILAQITKAIAEHGIELLAVCAWEEGREGIIRLVTEDHRRTMDILNEQNLDPIEGEVVVMELAHRPGMLRHVTGVLAENGIDIKCVYGSSPLSADACMVVMATSDTDRTVVVLNRSR